MAAITIAKQRNSRRNVIYSNQLDVVIPVKDRPTIGQCVLTIKESLSKVGNVELGNILVCDGGSQTATCQRQMAIIQQIPKVTVLSLSQKGFNKSWLLNQGIQTAKAPIVLISDADILWSATAIRAMMAIVREQTQTVCCIRAVKESEPNFSVPAKLRYTYRIESARRKRLVEIYPTAVNPSRRPGCGLLCARRSLFLQVGGYCHSFEHWGWEDRDFLIRAELMGYQRVERGNVVHLSHGDSLRNLPEGGSILESRDRNIRICLNRLAKGQLIGDLQHERSLENLPVAYNQPIQTRYVPMSASTIISS